jgi:integrase
MNQNPVQININAHHTKTGNPRITFISSEAKESLNEWFKVRTDYLKAAVGKSHLFNKKITDSRVFPFEDTTARQMWYSALKKTRNGQRDKSTKRYRLHPHVLRKFFRTKLGSVISVDVVEALMGHEGYLTEVYKRYSIEDLAKFYKKGEHSLLVFTEAAELGKLRIEVEEKNKQLQTLVNGLTAENMAMKLRLEKQEKKLRKVEEILEQFQEHIC